MDWRTPFFPEHSQRIDGDDFSPVFGSGNAGNGGYLRVVSAAKDNSALQSIKHVDMRAADLPILRYRFAAFPRTLELHLVFRTTEHPDDVQSISLPWPGSDVSTFDLSRVGEWKGHIIELGFAEFPTALNVPPGSGFKPFDIVAAELWSPSWCGRFAALTTEWFAVWPWSQRSMNALGRETDIQPVHSLVLVTLLAALIAIIGLAVLPGLRGARLHMAAIACVAIAWFALDLRWQSGLVHRLAIARGLYSGLAWSASMHLVGDADIDDAATRLRNALRDEPVQTRVLVEAGSRYRLSRMIWHLLPLNVGEFGFARPFSTVLPEGCVIAFLDNDTWETDPDVRALLANSQRIYVPGPSRPNAEDTGRLTVFRYHHD
ncbi:MAG: hypothetical protein LBQ20_05185 [Rhodanobacter sp.]|nr:hypothetical protein [Rhodanobacter sp.]